MSDAPTTALLAVNLGTPETPTAPAVRRYLAEFLGDRRVVSIPPLLWKPLLYGLILPLRGGRSAHKYAQVWMAEGSPLAVHTRRLVANIARELPHWQVREAMRYGQPALQPALDALAAAGATRIVVLPLYPQYSTTTTASVEDKVQEWQARHRDVQVHTIRDYADDPQWVAAVAASIRDYWQAHGRGDRLVFSFHGIPQRLADAGDPYPQRCEASARAIALPGMRWCRLWMPWSACCGSVWPAVEARKGAGRALAPGAPCRDQPRRRARRRKGKSACFRPQRCRGDAGARGVQTKAAPR